MEVNRKRGHGGNHRRKSKALRGYEGNSELLQAFRGIWPPSLQHVLGHSLVVRRNYQNFTEILAWKKHHGGDYRLRSEKPTQKKETVFR
jgi:hypothetical protein